MKTAVSSVKPCSEVPGCASIFLGVGVLVGVSLLRQNIFRSREGCRLGGPFAPCGLYDSRPARGLRNPGLLRRDVKNLSFPLTLAARDHERFQLLKYSTYR